MDKLGLLIIFCGLWSTRGQTPIALSLYSNADSDYVLSTVSVPNYGYQATCGYCYGDPANGTCPIFEYSYANKAFGNVNFHYYTTTWGEVQVGGGNSYTFLGIPCYVFCNNTPIFTTRPVYQFSYPTIANSFYTKNLQGAPTNSGTYVLQKIAWYMY